VSLTAAIIVENQADGLDSCLGSLAGLVDEIVVVDTGSSDRTVAVAEQHGAVVAHGSGSGDFAGPGNRALDLVTGDWVLSVDADEQVRGDFARLRDELDAAERCVGFRVRFAGRTGWTPVREHRLWRNRPDIRFQGHIRETVVPSVRAVAEADDLQIESLDCITVVHGERDDAIGERARDEPLLVAELARDPGAPFAYDRLARLYETAGDGLRAVDTWKRGIVVARGRDDALADDLVLYVDLVHYLLAAGVIDDDLEELVGESRRRFARSPTLELAAARLAFATGRPRDALEPLEWLIGLDDDDVIATDSSCDERVVGEWAWGLLGLCRFALGDDAAAAEAFERAERLAPDDPSYGVRRRLAEARAATPTI
jgi:glycosyltransferase involved in cell wall biosynthesis